jgi:C1A family cysteine protease
MMMKRGMGWVRDLPDLRDYAPDNPKVMKPPEAATKVADWFSNSEALHPKAQLPGEVNLARYCSPIEDQVNLGSCTAQAGAGLIEYFEKRAFGRHLDASRLFLYKVTRNLLGWTGDTGAYLRSTMKTMALFGVLPEQDYPYDIARYDEEPSAFHYAYAANFRSIRYFRLDQAGMSGNDVLKQVRQFLAAGYPSMFGFTVYNYGNEKGELEYPTTEDSALGGHAVVAVGYDDSRRIGSHQGALRIRNSWGTGWGDGGYGWLPYEYVRTRQAVDFWSLFKMEYVNTNQFS